MMAAASLLTKSDEEVSGRCDEEASAGGVRVRQLEIYR